MHFFISLKDVNITDKGEQLSYEPPVEGYYLSTNSADEFEVYRFKSTDDLGNFKQKIIADGTIDANQLYTNRLFLIGVYGDDSKLVDTFKQMK